MPGERAWLWVVPVGRVVLFATAIVIAGVRAFIGTVDAVTVELLALATVVLLYDQVGGLSLFGFKVWALKKASQQVVEQVQGGPVEELRAARRDLESAVQELAVAYQLSPASTSSVTIRAAADLGVVPPATVTLATELAKLYALADGRRAKRVTASLARDCAMETSLLVGVLRKASIAAPRRAR